MFAFTSVFSLYVFSLAYKQMPFWVGICFLGIFIYRLFSVLSKEFFVNPVCIAECHPRIYLCCALNATAGSNSLHEYKVQSILIGVKCVYSVIGKPGKHSVGNVKEYIRIKSV